jgi:hypothetical protein
MLIESGINLSSNFYRHMPFLLKRILFDRSVAVHFSLRHDADILIVTFSSCVNDPKYL